MQTRKLVKTGADTYTISIPKGWIKQNKIKKGDLLWIEEGPDNLFISKDPKDKKFEPKEISFSIDQDDLSTLRRETIGAYINNYNVFVFHGKTLNKRVSDIQKILDNFIALTIVDQTDTKLVARDFLNIDEVSLEGSVRRMDMLARTIMKESRNHENLNQLRSQDFEVDKLFFLISRFVRYKLFKHKEPVEAMKMWWLAKNLEKISDAAKELCGVYDSKIEDFYREVEQYYISAMTAFFKHDGKTADKLITKRLDLLQKNDRLNIQQRIFFRDIIDASRNICKIILDF
ncbi:MAG: PhoU domain-containing protein [Candidatus Woesearchaeota archaeon]